MKGPLFFVFFAIGLYASQASAQIQVDSVINKPTSQSEVSSKPDLPNQVEPKTAGEIYAKALILFKERRWDEAAQQFIMAYKIDPDSTLAYNAGRSLEYSGDIDQAELWYFTSLRSMPDKELRIVVNSRLEELSIARRNLKKRRLEIDQVSMIDISSVPTKAEVYINDRFVGLTPYQASQPIGGIDVKVQSNGFDPILASHNVEAGKELVLSYAMIPSVRTEAWITLGVGVSLLSLGVLAGVESQALLDESKEVDKLRNPAAFDKTIKDGKEMSQYSVVLYSLGSISLLASGYFFFFDGNGSDGDAKIDVPGNISISTESVSYTLPF